MTKIRTKFICTECKTIHYRWAGKCNQCNSWNTIEEISEDLYNFESQLQLEIKKLSEIHIQENIRIRTGIEDLDLVLGGGLVPGSFILIGGEPGVGKSTLMLMIAHQLSRSGKKILYFSGEESPEQIRLRADRMKITGDTILITKESRLEHICHFITRENPHLTIIDSVQTIQTKDDYLPGTVSQLRQAVFQLLKISKQMNIPIILIGHITREGNIAGPKLLEHMVDTVLYFESDRFNHFRILRAIKNRFGNVGEVAIFEMIPEGLKIISTLPQELHSEIPAGCTYSVMLEGSRALAVEIQALVSRNNTGPVKRMAEGLDIRRVILLIAVLEKFLKLNLNEKDIFTNLAGGLTSHEPALDLAICSAILSSYIEKSVHKTTAFIGEVGLTGEIRPTPRLGDRIKELQNLGFEKIYIPPNQKREANTDNIEIIEMKHVKELLGVFP